MKQTPPPAQELSGFGTPVCLTNDRSRVRRRALFQPYRFRPLGARCSARRTRGAESPLLRTFDGSKIHDNSLPLHADSPCWPGKR
jgi:hypothetical protein